MSDTPEDDHEAAHGDEGRFPSEDRLDDEEFDGDRTDADDGAGNDAGGGDRPDEDGGDRSDEGDGDSSDDGVSDRPGEAGGGGHPAGEPDDMPAGETDDMRAGEDIPRTDRGDAGAPLEDLVERTRQGDGEDDDVMDAFEEVEIDDGETEALWEQLEQERIEETVDDPHSETERDVRVISKRHYCMRCQHFSAPPEVRCEHETGEILEVVDTDRFEVADCPILRGEEELENLRR